MKHLVRPLLLVAVLAALLCVSAFASDSGFSDLTSKKDDVTLTAQKKDKSEATEQSGIYVDSVRIGMKYAGAVAGKEYLVIVTNAETTAPTKDNIVYIDQVTANEADGASFNIYPSALKNGTYHIYLSSNASSGVTKLEEVGTYAYHQAYEVGDVNATAPGEAGVNTMDAIWILQYLASINSPAYFTDFQREHFNLEAAEVEPNGKIDSMDAVWVLQRVANLRDEDYQPTEELLRMLAQST